MIQVNNYRIRLLDAFNYVIERCREVKSGKRTGNIDWVIIGYYGSLSGGLKRFKELLVQEDLEAPDALSIVAERLSEVDSQLLEACEDCLLKDIGGKDGLKRERALALRKQEATTG